jgi:translocation protein SEC63
VPAIFIAYYQRQKNYAPNGVLLETLQFMGFSLADNLRVRDFIELLGASAESREGKNNMSREELGLDSTLKPLISEITEYKIVQQVAHIKK